MSFFDRIWWWGSGDVGPEKDFTMILGEGLDGKKKNGKKGKYGTGYERMTSPGREYLMHLHVEKDAKTKPTSENVKDSNLPEEDKEDNKKGASNKQNGLDSSKNSEAENSFNIAKVFTRDRNTKIDAGTKPTLDQISFYSYGPITKYMDSICKFPYEDIPNANKLTVSKITWGYHHMIVQLDNGMVFVSGDNSQGQLGLNPKKFPSITGLVPQEEINNVYEIIGNKLLETNFILKISLTFCIDIGCGSNHTVFMALLKIGKDITRKLLTCGYHGCLGVIDVNEDTHQLQQVYIPDLADYDKIEYLICKFNSSAVLDDDNNLYYWGDDFDGFRERIPEK